MDVILCSKRFIRPHKDPLDYRIKGLYITNGLALTSHCSLTLNGQKPFVRADKDALSAYNLLVMDEGV